MGHRIDSYKRDELRRIALPGQAVSTLFWVLPIGEWRMGELDQWWDHFTRHPGTCQELGLLLVRDPNARTESRADQSANLQEGLAAADGGSLLDLIPEAERHTHSQGYRRHRGKSLLIFSGAYPQPGWGLLLDLDYRHDEPERVERLLDKVIDASCPRDKLDAIRKAAQAYHLRQTARSGSPCKPNKPPEIEQLGKYLDEFGSLLALIESGSGPTLESAFARVRNVFKNDMVVDCRPDESFWNDMNGRLRLLKDLSAAVTNDAHSLSILWSDFSAQPAEERDAHLKGLPPRDSAQIRKIRFLQETWPDLDVSKLADFLANNFRPDLLRRIEEGIATGRNKLETRFKEISGDFDFAQQQYESHLTGWREKLREAEAAYRATLGPASAAQWELGPAFLMTLESASRAAGLHARSIAWDPARMIGWKLHVSMPGLKPRHLLIAANSVLDGVPHDLGMQQPPGPEFSGSLFADYVYFVSMSANRMTPWEATKFLFTKLLNLGQLEELLDNQGQTELLPTSTEEEMAEQLLHKWGWKEQNARIARPILGCLGRDSKQKLAVTSSLKETRIAFESLLKDVLRTTFATLGWNDTEAESQLLIHCPNYERSRPPLPWGEEIRKLTAGAAILILEKLLPLGFPSESESTSTDPLINTLNRVRVFLNRDVHDNNMPAPTGDELNQLANDIQLITEGLGQIVGEMPWHLSPVQTFGSDPAIVTGHAWSHSHVEERMIRVMLWAGDKSAKDMLVWNRALTNPVMTDAVLL